MLKTWVLPPRIGLLHHRCVYVFVCVCVRSPKLVGPGVPSWHNCTLEYIVGRLYSLEMSNLDYMTLAIYLVFSVCIWFI